MVQPASTAAVHIRVPPRRFATRGLALPPALRLRGAQARDAGELKLAEALLLRAAELSQGDLVDLLALGQTYERCDRQDAAAACYERASRLAPASAIPVRALGRVLLRLGRWEEAEACLGHLLMLNPADVAVRLEVGRARRARGDLEGARAAFHGAARQVPGDGVAVAELARTRLAQGEPAAALRELGRLRGLAGEDADVELVRAQAHLSLGEPRVAERGFRAVLARLPVGHRGGLEAEAQAGLLRAQVRRGLRPVYGQPRPQDSVSLLIAQTEMARSPTQAEALLPIIQARLLAPLPEADRVALRFALGDLYDGLGQADRAIAAWVEGNHRMGLRWNEARLQADMDETQAWFSARALSQPPLGPAAADTIVVVGAPGAGAGLVAELLAEHSQVRQAHLADPVEAVREFLPRRVGRPWPDCLDWLGSRGVATSARRAMGLERQSSPHARSVLHLGPRGLLEVGAVARLLPEARILFVERNSWDQGLSLFRRPLRGHGLEHSGSFEDIARATERLSELSAHWRLNLPDSPLRLSFDDLLCRPQATLRALTDSLGLQAFDDEHPIFDRIRPSGHQRWARYARWLGPLGELPERL